MAKLMALALAVKPEQVLALDAVINECSLQHINAAQQFEATFRMAAGVRKLRELITADAMKDIMQLQGTALGFRTDRDKNGGYDVDTVKDCVIEATLRGLRVVGNEFNIISQRCYTTKEGFARLVREFNGLSNLKLTPSVPKMLNGGAVITYKATWLLNGSSDSIERDIPIKVNAGMGSDAIIGKATRKILCSVYERLTGSEYAMPEGEVGDDAIEVPFRKVQATTVDLPPAKQDTPDALFDNELADVEESAARSAASAGH